MENKMVVKIRLIIVIKLFSMLIFFESNKRSISLLID